MCAGSVSRKYHINPDKESTYQSRLTHLMMWKPTERKDVKLRVLVLSDGADTKSQASPLDVVNAARNAGPAIVDAGKWAITT